MSSVPIDDRQLLLDDHNETGSVGSLSSRVNAACQTPLEPGSSHTSLTASYRAPPVGYITVPYLPPNTPIGTHIPYPYGAVQHMNPYYLDDIFTGIPKDGHISPVRRFFCLFVTFDLALTSLLWLMSVVITGNPILAGLQAEVLHYTIETSLFDLCIAAGLRFILLIAIYAAFRLQHWLPVAVTTAGSVA